MSTLNVASSQPAKQTILVVDDEAAMVQFCTAILDPEAFPPCLRQIARKA